MSAQTSYIHNGCTTVHCAQTRPAAQPHTPAAPTRPAAAAAAAANATIPPLPSQTVCRHHRLMLGWEAEVGPTYRINLLWRQSVVTSDPQFVHALLRGGLGKVSCRGVVHRDGCAQQVLLGTRQRPAPALLATWCCSSTPPHRFREGAGSRVLPPACLR